jgi:hypothetical protein
LTGRTVSEHAVLTEVEVLGRILIMLVRRMRTLVSFGMLGCATAALVPLGCSASARIVHPEHSEGPRVPDETAERLRACVEDYADDLRQGTYKFDITVNVDEEGRVLDVETKGVRHWDLAACTRSALGAMAVPAWMLRVRPGKPLDSANGRTMQERALVGNTLLVIVAIALSDMVINAGGVTIVFGISVAIVADIVDAARRRPKPNLNRCLDAAADGRVLWENFCNAIADRADREGCWALRLESEEAKRGWCRWKFGK